MKKLLTILLASFALTTFAAEPAKPATAPATATSEPKSEMKLAKKKADKEAEKKAATKSNDTKKAETTKK